jgi:hypothetical protein
MTKTKKPARLRAGPSYFTDMSKCRALNPASGFRPLRAATQGGANLSGRAAHGNLSGRSAALG